MKQHKKRNMSIALVVVGIVGFGLHTVTSSQSVGKQVAVDENVVTSNGQAAPAKQTVTPAQQLASAYFSLALPAGYNPRPAVVTPGLLFAQTIIKPGSMGSQIINIAVRNLPSGGLSGDSSYSLRQSQPANYQLSSKTYDGDSVQLADSTQNAAVTAFWPHGAYEATITVTDGVDNPADGPNQDSMNALQSLLSAWHWK